MLFSISILVQGGVPLNSALYLKMCLLSLHNLGNLISPLTTLLAAFLGAWFAFLLQSRREKRNEKNA